MEDSNVRDDFEWFAHNQSDNTKIYGIILSNNFLVKLFKLLLVSYFMNTPVWCIKNSQALAAAAVGVMAFVGPVGTPVGSPKTRHTSLRAGHKEPEQAAGIGGVDGGGVDESIYISFKKNSRPLVYNKFAIFLVEWVECIYFLEFQRDDRDDTEMCTNSATCDCLALTKFDKWLINDWKIRKLELLLKRLTKIPRTGTGAEPSAPCGRCISVHDGSIGIGVAACAGRSERDNKKCSSSILGIQSETTITFSRW